MNSNTFFTVHRCSKSFPLLIIKCSCRKLFRMKRTERKKRRMKRRQRNLSVLYALLLCWFFRTKNIVEKQNCD